MRAKVSRQQWNTAFPHTVQQNLLLDLPDPEPAFLYRWPMITPCVIYPTDLLIQVTTTRDAMEGDTSCVYTLFVRCRVEYSRTHTLTPVETYQTSTGFDSFRRADV